MYNKDLALKQTLLGAIAHITDRKVMVFHTSAWQYQPYIHPSAKDTMENMLLETGHKENKD